LTASLAAVLATLGIITYRIRESVVVDALPNYNGTFEDFTWETVETRAANGGGLAILLVDSFVNYFFPGILAGLAFVPIITCTPSASRA
jgi:hypothetical protein